MVFVKILILILLLNLVIVPCLHAERTIKDSFEGYSESCSSFKPENLVSTNDSEFARLLKTPLWCATDKSVMPPINICCNEDRSEHEKCLVAIRSKGANQVCRTYGRGPALVFYLTVGKPLIGLLAQDEDCDVFMPEALEIKEFTVTRSASFPDGKFFRVTSDDDWVYQQYITTKSTAEALQTIIRKYGFTHYCRKPFFTMRRANASEMELLKDGNLKPGLREDCVSFNPANLIAVGNCFVDKVAKQKTQLCCGRGNPDDACLEFIKAQGITQKCKSDLDYYLAAGKAPQGPITGEKCGALLDPKDIQIIGLDIVNNDKKDDSAYSVKTSADRIYWITSKGDKVDTWADSRAGAQRKAGIMQKYGFTRYCSLSTINYWRTSRPDMQEKPDPDAFEGCAKFNPSRLKPQIAGREYAVTYSEDKELFQRGLDKKSYELWMKKIKNYGINEACFIGRSNNVHSLKIFYASGKIPQGQFPGEYCRKFNPDSLSLKQGTRTHRDYLLMDGDSQIYAFGDQTPLNGALKTLELIKQYGITHICFHSQGAKDIAYSVDAYFRK